ncbi:DUF938 domain-containing protein [Colwellia sp. UCD-KL20]|uniref:DUF938 domain-containing protein n=1 Tax=Colwellia sp. UCD-KL20 TaxID=1917165 RepID=UPI0009706A5D|nr:DUF938 domain-containing protein [Colwellia sp. UCD-KL20]
MTNKPFSQASENNKVHILPILQQAFSTADSVLEVGSGTGQHAVYFAKQLAHVNWQTSDLPVNHNGINQWIAEYPSNNLQQPLTLDLSKPWPIEQTSAIYTANTLHIISWELVIAFFEGVKKHLLPKGKLCIYGPFNYQGKFTSESNANFELWLKQQNELSGIRDFEAVLRLAEKAGLTLVKDHEMPANNRLLEFVNQ